MNLDLELVLRINLYVKIVKQYWLILVQLDMEEIFSVNQSLQIKLTPRHVRRCA